MNAKKEMLSGMSLDGQAIPVGGIKVSRVCPWGEFSISGYEESGNFGVILPGVCLRCF